jgi:diguanylate cyclase (GGDEF)-like protein/putative nucleotidyltransferase with HDIG domain
VSAVPFEPSLDLRAPDYSDRRDLPFSAVLYLWIVVALAVAVAAPLIAKLGLDTPGWTTFAILGIAGAVAQGLAVETGGGRTDHTAVVFVVAAALLLPPELVALVAVVQHVPDWLKRRFPLRMQAFNVASLTLAALAVRLTAHEIHVRQPFGRGGATSALIGAAACVAFVCVSDGPRMPLVKLTRGRATSALDLGTVATDLVLAASGVVLAAVWRHDAWLVPFVVAPLFLIHRSLAVPTLEAEARIDGKTGLYNAKHFASALREELERATRIGRPMSVVMADLDHLRDINNTHGHLAGDAVIAGIADIFRAELREYDVAARFGGEEFSLILPETGAEQALRIADRIRHAVGATLFAVPATSDPVRATISIGVASYPRDARNAETLVHQADVAVYRAKVQGRNRVVQATPQPLVAQPDAQPVSAEDSGRLGQAALAASTPSVAARMRKRSRTLTATGLGAANRKLTAFVSLVAVAGIGLGVVAARPGIGGLDVTGLLAVLALVAVSQALSIEVERMGAISVSAVGALAGAAIVGPRAALPVALTVALVEWSARRSRLHHVVFNVGALTLASLAAAQVFSVHVVGTSTGARGLTALLGLGAGAAYFAVNTGLLAVATALEKNDNAWRVWRERFAWLFAHYLAYGFVAAMVLDAYQAIGAWAIAVVAVPLFVIRETQGSYFRHTEDASSQLRSAAATIQAQNTSLEQANRMLRERSTAAMESLTATVDARDPYTAGHSRRVQELALAIGVQLALSEHELEVVGQAALFHDIGKLAVPEAVLLKPDQLDDGERELMERHAEEGAAIISRLGFLADAVPAIRHHHEAWDGSGYPQGLSGEEIPLGARIVHAADAFDSMVSPRVYRGARSVESALQELRRESGRQFCPRCVEALELLAADGSLDDMAHAGPSLVGA